METAFSRIETDFFDPEETRLRHIRYENAAGELRSALASIQAACAKGKAIASRAMRQNPNQAGQEKVLDELDEINRRITGSEAKEIAGFLFPPEALAEIGSGEHPSFNHFLASSITLYRSLAEAAKDGVWG
jgi:lipid II:glycine glycyltransferase (peptidoglycan interpeptide bridge formation enzyme)